MKMLEELSIDDMEVVAGGNRFSEVFQMGMNGSQKNAQLHSERQNRRLQAWQTQVNASLKQQEMAQASMFKMMDMFKGMGSMGGSGGSGGMDFGGGEMA